MRIFPLKKEQAVKCVRISEGHDVSGGYELVGGKIRSGLMCAIDLSKAFNMIFYCVQWRVKTTEAICW